VPSRPPHRFSGGFRGPSAAGRLWLPVVVSALVQLPSAFLGFSRAAGPRIDVDASTVPTLLLALVGIAALVVARRAPGPVVAVVAAAATLDLFVGGAAGPPFIALAFAIVSAIVRGRRLWAWISVGAGWSVALTAALLAPTDWPPGRIAVTTFGVLAVFGIGEGVRTRRERAAAWRADRERRRDDDLRAERVRIARELHDVLAHSLSSINVRAGVALHLVERRPDEAAAALADITETSRSALTEVRAVLGVLRAGDDAAPLVPEPDLARLPGLAASVSAQGVAVDLHADDLDDLPRPLQLAVYRIVQESLTNIVRHSRAEHAAVRVERRGDELVVRVRDDAPTVVPPPEPGRGLTGMRERADLLGGRLTAGPHRDGGFVVEAVLPLALERGRA